MFIKGSNPHLVHNSKRCSSYLLTSDFVSALDLGHVDKILEYGGIWGDSNPCPHQDGHIIGVPVLLASSVWAIHVQLTTGNSQRLIHKSLQNGKLTRATWLMHEIQYIYSTKFANICHIYLKNEGYMPDIPLFFDVALLPCVKKNC